MISFGSHCVRHTHFPLAWPTRLAELEDPAAYSPHSQIVGIIIIIFSVNIYLTQQTTAMMVRKMMPDPSPTDTPTISCSMLSSSAKEANNRGRRFMRGTRPS